jgi:hypothetical protein
MGACRNSFLVFVSDSRFRALDSQLRKQNHNCYFISTNAISSAQLKFYVGIIETNGKTANAMSQLQFKCHNCNSNGITAKTKLPKMCHVSSSLTERMSDCMQGFEPCECKGKGHRFRRLGF